MNLGIRLIGLLLDLTQGITWYKGRNSFPLFQNSFLPCCLILETGGGDARSQVFLLFEVWKWGIFGRDSSHSLLSNTIHVCTILCASFKYAFVYFSFCRATLRSCDVLYLHQSPLLLSSSFSLFKLLSFFFNFFFNSAELHLIRHISEFHSFAHFKGYSAECIHHSTVSCLGIF